MCLSNVLPFPEEMFRGAPTLNQKREFYSLQMLKKMAAAECWQQLNVSIENAMEVSTVLRRFSRDTISGTMQ
jgi:hypothetical protein